MNPMILHDRAPPLARPFSQEEYDRRVSAVKYRMATEGVDVLLVADPANMNYLTGYDGWSFYVPQAVLVALEHPTPIWIGRGMDASAARMTTFLADDDIIGYPDHYVQQRHIHPMHYVGEIVSGRGWGTLTIGVEMDAYFFSAMAWESLKSALPNARFKDAAKMVNWVRAVKSETEIALIRRAGRIVERVMDVAMEAIVPGRRQCDAVADIVHAQTCGTTEFGGDYTSIVPMLPSGPGTATPHLTWSDEVFKEGEATIIELAGAHRRYHSPMARTLFLGDPPQKLVDTAAIVVEGLEAALDAARPGATCEEVEEAWRMSTRKHGLVKESRIGYSTGCAYPPDWGEHTMSLRPGDTTVLQPNMVFHMIPGIWMDDWGIEISETFVVTPQGGAPIANVRRGLFVKG
ncbi:Xaa-Pro aminopeptidase [Caenispirillum salinarum AK4]|uniref:Xaa-Pro aminopeptidase n=1 Tax=Caenispirillum salinarum AK4 TaxID=1238182 RepID=K9HSZ6_9PROT|nr:M24 family metallopeptidase [Caenispirillum salinarum]EKV31441.1 Xaa-Pro aminopeptidase [Caenispirillum salinarum AK4]